MSGVQSFTKKPVTIQAIRLEATEASVKSVLAFMGETVDSSTSVAQGKFTDYVNEIVEKTGLSINTLEGVMTASVGDYIIRGVKSEFYPCKPDIFDATYTEARQEIHIDVSGATPCKAMDDIKTAMGNAKVTGEIDSTEPVEEQVSEVTKQARAIHTLIVKLEEEKAEVDGRIERAAVACATHEADPEYSKLPVYHYEVINNEQLEGMRIYSQALGKRIVHLRTSLV